MRLMVAAQDINVGAIVRATETDFNLVECFDPVTNQCRLSSHCRLRGVLEQAMESFFKVLDGVTLADLMADEAAAPQPISFTRTLRPVPGLPTLD